MTDGRVLSEEELKTIEKWVHTYGIMIAPELAAVTIPNLIATIRDLQRQVSELTQYSRSLEHDAERAGIAAMYAEIERDDYKAALHTAKFDIETGNVDVAKFVIDSVLAKHAPRQEDAK